MRRIKDLNQRLSVLEKGKGSASTTTPTTVLSTPPTPPTPAAKPGAQPSTKVNFVDDSNKQGQGSQVKVS